MTADANWDAIAPPLELPAGEELPPDNTPEDAPLCPVCEKPIIRDPTWKRMRKYHPECNPYVAGNKSREGTAGGGSAGAGRTKGGSGFSRKAEQEADECEKILQSAFVKLALGVSVFDKYDAFCIMVNTGPVCQSFRGVVLRNERFRKEMLMVKSGGSVVGLVVSCLIMVMPIIAHHGLIPSRNIAETMVRMPYLLFTLHQRMKEGEEAMTVLIKEQMAAMQEENRKREREARQRQAGQNGTGGDFVGASYS